MPTAKPMICFPADPDFLKRIDDYRYENRIPSRAEAVRRLIEDGLRSKQTKKAKKVSKP